MKNRLTSLRFEPAYPPCGNFPSWENCVGLQIPNTASVTANSGS